MTEGHIFEVTSEGELVWEYINPVTKDGVLEVIPDNYPMKNSIFRVNRYGPDYPALIGKDLTPKDTITGRFPEYEVIPECPSTIFLPLFITATLAFLALAILLIVIIYKRKHTMQS